MKTWLLIATSAACLSSDARLAASRSRAIPRARRPSRNSSQGFCSSVGISPTSKSGPPAGRPLTKCHFIGAAADHKQVTRERRDRSGRSSSKAVPVSRQVQIQILRHHTQIGIHPDGAVGPPGPDDGDVLGAFERNQWKSGKERARHALM
jgi:hypothetical protein